MMEETANGHVVLESTKDTPQLYRNIDEKESQKEADACLANVSLLFPHLIICGLRVASTSRPCSPNFRGMSMRDATSRSRKNQVLFVRLVFESARPKCRNC